MEDESLVSNVEFKPKIMSSPAIVSPKTTSIPKTPLVPLTPTRSSSSKRDFLSSHIRTRSKASSTSIASTDNAASLPKNRFSSANVAKAAGKHTASPEYFRQRVDQSENERDEEDDDDGSVVYAWDLPDHLPNSPLCPQNARLYGKAVDERGGKKVCPMHGRDQPLGGDVGREKGGGHGSKREKSIGTTSFARGPRARGGVGGRTRGRMEISLRDMMV